MKNDLEHVRERREVGEDAAGDAGLRRRGGAVPAREGGGRPLGVVLDELVARVLEDVAVVAEMHGMATLPDRPRSKKQRYITTEALRGFIAASPKTDGKTYDQAIDEAYDGAHDGANDDGGIEE